MSKSQLCPTSSVVVCVVCHVWWFVWSVRITLNSPGYRDAQCGWLLVHDTPHSSGRGKRKRPPTVTPHTKKAQCLCIYAPRRGIVEVRRGTVKHYGGLKLIASIYTIVKIRSIFTCSFILCFCVFFMDVSIVHGHCANLLSHEDACCQEREGNIKSCTLHLLVLSLYCFHSHFKLYLCIHKFLSTYITYTASHTPPPRTHAHTHTHTHTHTHSRPLSSGQYRAAVE